MESAILNLAHEKLRRADSLLQKGKFEEAADCYEKVSTFFADAHSQLSNNFADIKNSDPPDNNSRSAVSSVHSIVALESLALQSDYYKRQAVVVRMKQAQYDEYKNTLENQQKNILSKHVVKYHDKGSTVPVVTEKFEGSLRQAIYKTIEEQDSLLSLMSLPDDDQAFKHPKDTVTVIEELRTVNSQLRSLVESLLSQLEAKEQEVKQLTQRLHTVSVTGTDEMSSNEGHSLRLAPLPPLAPLEMPLFDFTSS
ncbi:nuclear receptor-binding factor 2-like [Microplitis mediator]|uniref:nuclear receptor-binding factor 2-like n=1 Tax=Microplitis mediator TaxID=375433 RepID=UPI002556DC2F|nr:nuclear receptor-binding factor 2-like [Microplitis mediator]